jgi:hypothetical protein
MQSSSEFSVTPMNGMVELVPGETYDFTVTVLNPANSTENLDYKVHAVPYSVVTEAYHADISTQTDHTRMADWITIPEPTGTLAPNETREIEFTITVPDDAPGGGQYAAIMVGIDNKNQNYDNMSVTNVLEIASIIYAKVDGEIIHKGEVVENSVPVFTADPKITLSSLIKNEGNMHEIASIAITVKNVFTGETLASAELDNGVYAELIMPDSQRFINKEVDGLPMMGIINVQQKIYYNGETSTVEKNVLICPIWFLILVALVMMAVVAKILKVIRKHRKKKKAQ